MPNFFELLFMTGGGWIAIIGFFVLLWIIFQQKVKLGRGLQVGAGIGAVVVTAIGLSMAGIIDMVLTFGEEKAPFAVQQEAVIPSGEVLEPTDLVQPASPDELGVGGDCKFVQNTHELKTALRNVENATDLGYLAASIAAESDGQTHDTGTTNAGATLSYQSLNVPPCKMGSLFVLASSGVGQSSARMAFSSLKTVSEYEILGARLDVIALQAYDRQGTKKSTHNISGALDTNVAVFVSGAGTTDGNAYYQNTSLTAGGSIQGEIALNVNGTGSVFGNVGTTVPNLETTDPDDYKVIPADDGVIYSFDSVDAAKFAANALTLTQIDPIGLTPLAACPASITANRNAEACWKSRTLKDADGDVLIKFQLKALGDPTTTGDSPKLCIDDKQYFRGADGRIKYDFFSAGGTNKGVAGVCLTWVVY